MMARCDYPGNSFGLSIIKKRTHGGSTCFLFTHLKYAFYAVDSPYCILHLAAGAIGKTYVIESDRTSACIGIEPQLPMYADLYSYFFAHPRSLSSTHTGYLGFL